MRIAEIPWRDAASTAAAIRSGVARLSRPLDVGPIQDEVLAGGDAALLRLTARYDATENPPDSLRVPPADVEAALAALDPALRESLELAAKNVRAVSEAQLEDEPREIQLPQGQRVTIKEVSVDAVGIYAPGGRAAYPSSVLMCAIPAQVAGAGRVALASPPGPDGLVPKPVLAAAALCSLEEVYAVGGAQAVFALAHGTETIAAVDVVAGPGNAWVQEAKRAVYGRVGLDSYAGPSELMVVAATDTEPRPAALDLCAQAEHGDGAVLVAVSTDAEVLKAIGEEAYEIGSRGEIDPGALLATIEVPSTTAAIDLANALAPEHLELLDLESARLADRVKTAGCVLTGPFGATAFGDYVAGSNHVLPTGGAGRFSGPLGPGAFRRRIATVEVSAESAAKLAPHVERLAQAEGFPVHGESAMIRSEESA